MHALAWQWHLNHTHMYMGKGVERLPVPCLSYVDDRVLSNVPKEPVSAQTHLLVTVSAGSLIGTTSFQADTNIHGRPHSLCVSYHILWVAVQRGKCASSSLKGFVSSSYYVNVEVFTEIVTTWWYSSWLLNCWLQLYGEILFLVAVLMIPALWRCSS